MISFGSMENVKIGGVKSTYVSQTTGDYILTIDKVKHKQSEKGKPDAFIVDFRVEKSKPSGPVLLKDGETTMPSPADVGSTITAYETVGSMYFEKNFASIFCAATNEDFEKLKEEQFASIATAIAQKKSKSEAEANSKLVEVYKTITSEDNPLRGYALRARVERYVNRDGKISTRTSYESVPPEHNTEEKVAARRESLGG